MAKRDLQPVKLDIDLDFIATRDAIEILDPVWWSGDIYGTVAQYDRSLRPFSREQRFMYALLWYEGEVGNGGHDQFFFNSTGIVFPDALSALDALPLPEGAAILREALRRMGGAPARNRARRQAQLERLQPDFADLDTRFYALDTQIGAAMTAYIRTRAASFVFRGTVRIPKSTLEFRKRLRKEHN